MPAREPRPAPAHARGRAVRTRQVGSPRRAIGTALAIAIGCSIGVVATASSTAAQVAQPPYEEFTAGYAVNGTYTPIVGNFTGADGREDILWYAPGSTPETLWQATTSRTARFAKVPVPAVNGTYVPVVGDFSSDGYDDIIWYGPGSAPDTLWNFTSTGLTTKALAISGTFTPVVLPNRFLPDSVLWYAPGNATDWLWAFDAGATFTSAPYRIDGTYRPIVGDLDADQLGDVFWYAPGPATDARWMRTGPQASASFTSVADPVNGSYAPIVGDFGTPGTSADASSDVAWTTTSGTDQVWDRTGSTVHRSQATIAGPKVVRVGDLGPDALISWGGTAGDRVWRSTTLGGDSSRATGLAKVAADAIPVVGRFGDADAESVLWYRPGAGAERYWTPYE